jgi:hypothetical protein
MNARTSRIEVRAARATREQVRDLLIRYPDVAANEATSILDFLRNGRHLEIGLLAGDERVQPKIEAFMAEHKKHFRLSVGEVARVVAVIFGFLVLCWLAWELVGPA